MDYCKSHESREITALDVTMLRSLTKLETLNILNYTFADLEETQLCAIFLDCNQVFSPNTAGDRLANFPAMEHFEVSAVWFDPYFEFSYLTTKTCMGEMKRLMIYNSQNPLKCSTRLCLRGREGDYVPECMLIAARKAIESGQNGNE